MLELSKLLDSGYEVSFIRDPAGYVASVSGPDYEHDCIADTPGEALWGASPLHPEDEPYPGGEPLTAEVAALRRAVNALTAREMVIAAVFEAGRKAAAAS